MTQIDWDKPFLTARIGQGNEEKTNCQGNGFQGNRGKLWFWLYSPASHSPAFFRASCVEGSGGEPPFEVIPENLGAELGKQSRAELFACSCNDYGTIPRKPKTYHRFFGMIFWMENWTGFTGFTGWDSAQGGHHSILNLQFHPVNPVHPV